MAHNGLVRAPVKVACVQAEPAILDQRRTLDKLESLAAEAARAGAELVVFPEAFVPAYPSQSWARYLAAWGDERAKSAFAMLARESVEVPGPGGDRLAEIARSLGVWLVTGVDEIERDRPGTIYNTLVYFTPAGELALKHRKLMPTNHERLVWGQGDGGGLRAIETPLGRLGGLICWENYMPLARFALYESGVEIYVASTADDGAGVAAVVRLARERSVPPGVWVLDGGTLGLSLLPLVESGRDVILVDAVRTEAPPGTLVRLEGDDVLRAALERLSPHQIGVADLLEAMRLRARWPRRLVLLGVVPERLDLRLGRSPAVAAAMPALLEAIVAEAHTLGHELPPRGGHEATGDPGAAGVARLLGL